MSAHTWPPAPAPGATKLSALDGRLVPLSLLEHRRREWFCGCRSALSDVRSKRDFAELNRTALLEGLEALPVRSWRYKAQGEGVRHVGPTAQDFHRLMGASVAIEHAFCATPLSKMI